MELVRRDAAGSAAEEGGGQAPRLDEGARVRGLPLPVQRHGGKATPDYLDQIANYAFHVFRQLSLVHGVPFESFHVYCVSHCRCSARWSYSCGQRMPCVAVASKTGCFGVDRRPSDKRESAIRAHLNPTDTKPEQWSNQHKSLRASCPRGLPWRFQPIHVLKKKHAQHNHEKSCASNDSEAYLFASAYRGSRETEYTYACAGDQGTAHTCTAHMHTRLQRLQLLTAAYSCLQRLQPLTAVTAAYSRLHSDWFVPPAARPGVSETHCLTQKRNPRTAVPRASS